MSQMIEGNLLLSMKRLIQNAYKCAFCRFLANIAIRLLL